MALSEIQKGRQIGLAEGKLQAMMEHWQAKAAQTEYNGEPLSAKAIAYNKGQHDRLTAIYNAWVLLADSL